MIAILHKSNDFTIGFQFNSTVFHTQLVLEIL